GRKRTGIHLAQTTVPALTGPGHADRTHEKDSSRLGDPAGNHQARTGLPRVASCVVGARALAPHRSTRRHGAADPLVLRHRARYRTGPAGGAALRIQRWVQVATRSGDDAAAMVDSRRAR